MLEHIKPLRPFSGSDKRVTVVRKSGKSFTVSNPYKLSGNLLTNCGIVWNNNIEDWILIEIQNKKTKQRRAM